MKAMILAAGLGKRMRPLTDHMPKPLIKVRGKPLIEWHLERIARAGITDVVINISYLGHMIRDYVGDGSRWGVSVVYSEEPEPLETGGAIVRAARWLDGNRFLLVNADVFTSIDFKSLLRLKLSDDNLGYLILVPNPDFKENGDFSLSNGVLADGDSYTFSGVSVIHPNLVLSYPQARRIFPLSEAFHWALGQKRLAGSVYHDVWSDVGTPARLQLLN